MMAEGLWHDEGHDSADVPIPGMHLKLSARDLSFRKHDAPDLSLCVGRQISKRHSMKHTINVHDVTLAAVICVSR